MPCHPLTIIRTYKEAILNKIKNIKLNYLFVVGDVPPDASPQVNYHAARGRHRVPGHRHQSSRLVVLRWTLNWGVDFIKQRQIIIRADEQYCLNILIHPCSLCRRRGLGDDAVLLWSPLHVGAGETGKI